MIAVPDRAGGWWHDYVCPTHDTELTGPADAGHGCTRGCVVVGDRYDAAWRTLQHQAAARELRRLARTGDSADRQAALEILDEIARVYATVVGPGWNESAEAWMLRGRMFAQALTEAQWAVLVADAVLLVDPEHTRPGVADLLAGLAETFEDAYHVLVDQRDDERNNYTAWLCAAGSLVAQAQGAAERAALWVQRADRHLACCLTADGWEWEGSTYYHLFVLRGHLLARRGADAGSLDPQVRERLAAMVRVLAEVAAPDGRLPAIHDGPYDRPLAHREVLEIDALASGLFTSTGLERVAQFARASLGEWDDGLERLLSDWFTGSPEGVVEVSRGCVHYPSMGYAVLRDAADSIQVVVDAGEHGGSHGHLDKLGLYLYGNAAWQPAPGVPPYASGLRRGYYARTLAHPTVRVDDVDQDATTGEIRSWDPQGRRLLAEAEPYPGIRMQRSVTIEHGVVVDVFRVEADSPRNLALALRPAVDLEIATAGEVSSTRWRCDTGAELHGTHAARPEAALQAVPGRGTSEDPARVRTLADWKVQAPRAEFVSVYQQGVPVPCTIEIDAPERVIVRLNTPAGERTIEVTS
ncbi:heparinase II/III domain-containing protein [Serinibacter salmoneus]|uniref:Heparinase II/III-like protein n=1 Tax=Serinibacter salmoneus TaxID=556530 RepID=A0A2A9CYT4_9MICO|nr:heparinase II/III family protein [Serinibacter salmoneus]PFG19594.1 heparinase II/III-like protein [Serinibacter salmoneus]